MIDLFLVTLLRSCHHCGEGHPESRYHVLMMRQVIMPSDLRKRLSGQTTESENRLYRPISEESVWFPA